jgi:hypothetical protein
MKTVQLLVTGLTNGARQRKGDMENSAASEPDGIDIVRPDSCWEGVLKDKNKLPSG